MKRIVCSIFIVILLAGCNVISDEPVFSLSSEDLFQKAEDGWREAGYALMQKTEPSPIALAAPERYYDAPNGDTLAIYVFPTGLEASEAKIQLQSHALKWDVVPVYGLKGNVLFIYFTSVTNAKLILSEQVEKVVSSIHFSK